MKFRTKPVEIEAMFYTGSNYAEVKAFAGEFVFMNDDGVVICKTLEGPVTMVPRQHVIVNEREAYPCDPDHFDNKYEPV